MEGRCMKCKQSKKMVDVSISSTPKGAFMAKGFCESCRTPMCKIMSKDSAEKAISQGEAKKSY